MKFDILVEQHLKLLSEAGVSRSSKFSNIEIDTDRLLEKLNAGDFDILITSWANNKKYGNVSEDDIKQVITKLAEDIKTYEISNFEDLKDTVESIADDIYSDKGFRRQSFVGRLSSSIAGLVMHKEYNLVSVLPPKQERQEADALTGLTEVENAVVDYIERSEEPVTLDILNKQFSGADSIIETLAEKGVVAVNPQGIITVVSRAFEGELKSKENPLDADEDVRTSFSRTMGRNTDDDFDYERVYQDPESVSWIPRD
jgi:hypothetical protein